MNQKQFGILVVLLVICATAAWYLYQGSTRSWQSAGQTIGGKLLPNLPINNVAQIDIRSGTNQLTLARIYGLWTVGERGNYPANFSQISELLMKLADLKAVQHVQAGPSELPRFSLTPPATTADSGTLLELRDTNGKSVASLLLGKQHMNQPASGEGWPDGRYVIANNNNADVAVISETFENVAPKPADWLDKSFFKISDPKSIAVEFTVKTNSWKLTRASETNDWQLAGARPGEKLDSSKVDDITGSFDSPSFNDVIPGITTLETAATVTIETFGGTNYVANIWPSTDDNDSMVISIEASNGKRAADNQFAHFTYEIPSYTFESLLKPRTNLLETVTATKGS